MIYLCGDILAKHYPDLYPQSDIPCPICHHPQDSNSHLGFCDNFRPFLNDTLARHKSVLIELVTRATTRDNMTKFIPDSVERLSLFSPVSDTKHDVYLILHNLIPQDLYNLIYSYVNKYSPVQSVIFEFMTSLVQQLYDTIWKEHNDKLHQWEKSLGITTKKKKRYETQLFSFT